MAGFQLEDLLRDDRKDANLIPDLSKATCNSQEEFRRLMECCPEFKIKPEKVRREDIKVRDKDFSWRITKKELRAIRKEWNYGDPIPPDMRVLNLQELQQVAIDWRMLTSVRPKLRQDEEMFSRLVEMGKLQMKTKARERRNFVSPIRRAKNRAGIIESSVRICGDCGEEFCNGESCGDVLYDAFIRVTVTTHQAKARITGDAAAIIAGMDSGKGTSGKSGKKKRKRGTGGPSRAGNKGGSSKAVRLLVRKGKTGKGGAASARKESDRSDDAAKTPEAGRKFRRKCTKYPAKKKTATASTSKS